MVTQRISLKGMLLAATALVLTGLATGCGGSSKSPLNAAVIQGGLFANAGTVSGRGASALAPVANATLTLTPTDGNCTAKAGSTLTATTDANGRWTATANAAGQYFISSITATGYNFTALLANCANRTATATVGSTTEPPGFPAPDANGNLSTAATSTWNTVVANITPDTATTGNLLLLATINDSGQTPAPSADGISVSINGTTHPTGVTGTVITGVVAGTKTLSVVYPAGASGLETPTAVSAVVSAGATVTASIALDRVVSALNLTGGSVSSGGTQNLTPTCNLAAIVSNLGSLSASTGVACPSSKAITYTLSPNTGTVSGGVYTAPATVTEATTVTVTGTLTSNGSPVTGTATINLSPCPSGQEAIPGGTGCGTPVSLTINSGATNNTVVQHSTLTQTWTATCGYDTNGDQTAETTGNCTSSTTFTAAGTGAPTFTGAAMSRNVTPGTYAVTGTKGSLTSTPVNVVVSARTLTGLAVTIGTTGSTTATITYTGGTPSSTSLTLTPTCSYNSGADAESLSCLTTNENLNITQPTNGTLNAATYTPPTSVNDDVTDTIVFTSATNTTLTSTVTINLSAGPQSCTGITGFCIDIAELTATNGAAATLSVTGANLPTGGLSGATIVFTYPQGLTFNEDSITAGTGWTKTTAAVDTTNRRVSVVLQGNVSSNTTFFTVSVTPSSAGTFTLSPVSTGTPRSSFSDANAGLVANFTMRNGKVTVQ